MTASSPYFSLILSVTRSTLIRLVAPPSSNSGSRSAWLAKQRPDKPAPTSLKGPFEIDAFINGKIIRKRASAKFVGSRKVTRLVISLWFDVFSFRIATDPARPLDLALDETFSQSLHTVSYTHLTLPTKRIV